VSFLHITQPPTQLTQVGEGELSIMPRGDICSMPFGDDCQDGRDVRLANVAPALPTVGIAPDQEGVRSVRFTAPAPACWFATSDPMMDKGRCLIERFCKFE
jgi:hypothetical protein